jgi:hypothetical protein
VKNKIEKPANLRPRGLSQKRELLSSSAREFDVFCLCVTPTKGERRRRLDSLIPVSQGEHRLATNSSQKRQRV